jgi:hypothetical protein
MTQKATKPNEKELTELLAKLLHEIELMKKKLDVIIEGNAKILETQTKQQVIAEPNNQPGEGKVPDVMSLLTLPMSLRTTMLALYKLDKATAEELAKETKRLRAVESSAANQLVRLGYLGKKREGRDVYFYIESSLELTK